MYESLRFRSFWLSDFLLYFCEVCKSDCLQSFTQKRFSISHFALILNKLLARDQSRTLIFSKLSYWWISNLVVLLVTHFCPTLSRWIDNKRIKIKQNVISVACRLASAGQFSGLSLLSTMNLLVGQSRSKLALISFVCFCFFMYSVVIVMYGNTSPFKCKAATVRICFNVLEVH